MLIKRGILSYGEKKSFFLFDRTQIPEIAMYNITIRNLVGFPKNSINAFFQEVPF